MTGVLVKHFKPLPNPLINFDEVWVLITSFWQSSLMKRIPNPLVLLASFNIDSF